VYQKELTDQKGKRENSITGGGGRGRKGEKAPGGRAIFEKREIGQDKDTRRGALRDEKTCRQGVLSLLFFL